MSDDDMIEQAARVLWEHDNLNSPEWLEMAWNDMGGSERAEERVRYELQARDLDAAGLLARPLPTRDEIANAIHGDQCPDDPDLDEYCSCGAGDYDRMGDIVLDLLKGEDSW